MELLAILALAFGAMWFMSSKTRKQQKEAMNFRANLAPGQEVMTGSGVFGTIVAVDGDVITLELSEGVTSRWLRAAIAKLVDPPAEDDDADEDDEDEYDDEYDDDEYDDEDDDVLVDDVPLDDAAAADRPAHGAADPTRPLDAQDIQVPDDASSLTARPDEDDAPRR